MAHRSLLIISAAIIGLATASGALADGDAKKGKRVFNKCKACHAIDREQNRIGPHLVQLFGRKAGTVKGFKYSPAMAKSGIVWDAKKLAAYITDPKKFVPGNKMIFPGLKNEEQREDLIAYMKQQFAK